MLRAAGTYPGDDAGIDIGSADPLKRYPRMIHMHRWDETSLQWMIDARLNACMTALLGREPFAVQTMLYFKPAGARGQALHQDQYYLRVRPGTCMAAWMALDPCDEENGCLQVVPGTHSLPVLCTQKADTTVSFTDVTVPVPEGAYRRRRIGRGVRSRALARLRRGSALAPFDSGHWARPWQPPPRHAAPMSGWRRHQL